MDKVGLILEGGGMRGLYTAGILDYFMKKEFYAPYVIGVSMGHVMLHHIYQNKIKEIRQ